MSIKPMLSTFALLAACMASPAFATTYNYSATMSGASENPANASTATGFETFSLTGDLLTVNVTFSGLSAPASAAHIHCCGAEGVNEPVVLPYTGFPNFASGSYSHTFDLSAVALGGGVTEAGLIAGLNSGMAYANIHDANFPSGEIRGQIMPTVTPEPDSLLLVATGLVGTVGMLRRKFGV